MEFWDLTGRPGRAYNWGGVRARKGPRDWFTKRLIQLTTIQGHLTSNELIMRMLDHVVDLEGQVDAVDNVHYGGGAADAVRPRSTAGLARMGGGHLRPDSMVLFAGGGRALPGAESRQLAGFFRWPLGVAGSQPSIDCW